MTESDKSQVVLRALSALAKSSRLSINELRIILALERIVARIDAHAILREKLIFKGGFVLYKILESERFTRDLDALARELPREDLSSWVSEALQNDLHDGVYFAIPQVEDLTDQGPIFKSVGDSVIYEYDFGDSWQHTVRLERIVDEPEVIFAVPRCLDGENA